MSKKETSPVTKTPRSQVGSNVLEEDVSKKKVVAGKLKKKSRKRKTVKTNTNAGPPSEAANFSSNWKKFLVSQTDKDVSTSISRKSEKMKKERNDGSKTNRKRKRKENENIENKEENKIWFDVDPKLLKSCTSTNNTTQGKDSNNNPDSTTTPDKENQDAGNMTRYLALDCEMVGVGIEGKESVLARVSIVNSHCQCVYDKYVRAEEKVRDYRTQVSGIRPEDLKDAWDYATVQREVSEMLKDRVLVGHALHNDLKVLMLSHPKKNTRDTSKYKPFRKVLKTKRPALKRLVKELLHEDIQVGEHSSVIDAQVTMRLYKMYKKEWEKSLRVKDSVSKLEVKEVFMGTNTETEKKKKKKVNKWTKIRDQKNKKKRKKLGED